MKKFLSLVLAMLVSAAALTACGDNGDTTTKPGSNSGNGGGGSGSGSKPAQSDSQTAGNGGKTTTASAESTTSAGLSDDPYYDALMALYRRFEDAQVSNVEAFLQDAANQNLMLGTSASGAAGLELFDSFNEELSIYSAMTEQEAAPNLFDVDSFSADTSTKWCGGSAENEYSSAIVWSMTDLVNVTGYSITTGNDNSQYTSRGPITWRLYGCKDEIPPAKLDSASTADPDLTYFDTYTVPEGWELIDAVDAMKDGNPLESVFPDEDFAEIFIQLKKPAQYKHFMFLLDTNESNCIQMSSFNLYGTKAE